MRKSLAGVRARVERLVSNLGSMEGCATCRADTMPRIRHVFYDEQVGPVTGGPVTCSSCGRNYPVMTIVHEHHAAEPSELPA
ncbi:MAG: hypothetical protein DMF84_26785 [Acidobacteria bacterium]|nr:MAG: hypothetical protein DMF84_26785 [Acidobacteriota bacterium]